jgi:hypothetical protein
MSCVAAAMAMPLESRLVERGWSASSDQLERQQSAGDPTTN